MSRLNNITGTGDVGGANGGAICSVILTAGSGGAATLVLKEGGSGGTTMLNLSAAANDSVQVQLCDAEYSGQLHATLAGAGATANVELV